MLPHCDTTLMPLKLPQCSLYVLLLCASGIFPAPAQEDDASPGYFGSQEKSESALIGILYDLKQNQKHEPQKADYPLVIGDFVREGWNEADLNKYYRVTKPLYATQIFIPRMNANEAPKAFGAEKQVKPSQWVIHYKGQVSPPKSGTFRFVGLADDIIVVAIDGKTVFIGTHPGSRLKDHGFDVSPHDGPKTPSGLAQWGEWLNLKGNEIYDMEVLVGERPGGQFGAWLMVEEQGVDYPRDGGKPILPVFQLAEHPLPTGREIPNATAAKPNEIWKSFQ